MGKRTLEELNLLDDFLFQETISRAKEGEEVCRILLSTILGRPIRRVRVVAQKPILGVDTTQHGIRLDAYIEDISENGLVDMADAEVVDVDAADIGASAFVKRKERAGKRPDIYDVEPNNTYKKNSLPKRTRYYQALIDSKILDAGEDYRSLQNVVVIMILPYDPFDKERMVYTIKNQCIEDSSVKYEDGATKIYLYTRGTQGNPSQELRDMLQYIEQSVADNVKNQSIAAIHDIVSGVKKDKDKEVGINYMKSWERDQEKIEEGQEKGEEMFAQLVQKLLQDKRTEDLEHVSRDKEFRQKLYQEYGIGIDADDIDETE